MKTGKISMLALALCAAGIPKTFAQSADEIWQKHIDAVGGIDNWNKVKSVKANGSMNVQGMDIDMNTTVVNGKGMRVDIVAGGMNGYIIITPTEGWQFMPFQGQTKPEPLPAEAIKESQNKLDARGVQLVDKSVISKLELQGKDSVDNMSCYKIKVTAKDNSEETCYIDAATYYLVKISQKATGPDGQEVEGSYSYSNFKKLPEGIYYPMAMNTMQGDVVIKSVEINKPVDDALFKPGDK